MSAYRFVISDERVKGASDEELQELLKKHQEIVDNFDWNTYKQAHFTSDRASGMAAGLRKIKQEIELRANGTPEVELDQYSVPGYNPKRDNK